MLKETSGIATGEDEAFGDELWGFYESRGRLRTEATDGSDFTPAQLEAIKRNIFTGGAPLPGGVQDVQWQPPTSTGLAHSAPIFETETDMTGGSGVTSKMINEDNCHYRSWQEDNGVARNFAVKSVEKAVDGQMRTVLISPAVSMRMSQRSMTALTTSGMKSMVRSSPSISSAGESCDGDKIDEGERDVAGTMSSPALESSKSTPSVLPYPPAEVVNDAAEEGSSPQPVYSANCESLVFQGNVTGPSCTSTTGSAEQVSPAPRRPSGGSTSNQRQKPRPGRSLSTKEIVDDRSMLVAENKVRRVEGALRPSQATSSRGKLDLAAVIEGECCAGASYAVTTTQAKKAAAVTTTVETTGVTSNSDVGGEATTVSAAQGDEGGRVIQEQREGEDATGGALHKPSFQPNAKGRCKAFISWWGGSQAPGAPPPDSSQPPPRGSTNEKQRCVEEPVHPAQRESLPPGPEAAGNRSAPQRTRWLVFRRNRRKNAAKRH